MLFDKVKKINFHNITEALKGHHNANFIPAVTFYRK